MIQNRNCDCASPDYTDCDKCTANTKCNWVDSAQVQVNLTIPIVGQLPTLKTWNNKTCVSGSIAGPFVDAVILEGSGFKLSVEQKPLDWYFGQCKLVGDIFLVVVVGASVVGSAVACIVAGCVYRTLCGSRRGGFDRV